MLACSVVSANHWIATPFSQMLGTTLNQFPITFFLPQQTPASMIACLWSWNSWSDLSMAVHILSAMAQPWARYWKSIRACIAMRNCWKTASIFTAIMYYYTSQCSHPITCFNDEIPSLKWQNLYGGALHHGPQTLCASDEEVQVLEIQKDLRVTSHARKDGAHHWFLCFFNIFCKVPRFHNWFHSLKSCKCCWGGSMFMSVVVVKLFIIGHCHQWCFSSNTCHQCWFWGVNNVCSKWGKADLAPSK